MTAFFRGARITTSPSVGDESVPEDDLKSLLSGAMRLQDGGAVLVQNHMRPGLDEHALYGLARLNGREYRVRAWWKPGRNGEWLKLRLTLRDAPDE